MAAAKNNIEDLVLYSDGGSQNGLGAACAAIVDRVVDESRIGLVGYLGNATNNEAEICGALLGFSFVRAYREATIAANCSLRWVCDSEYVLKSATQYIHNWQRNGWKTANKDPVKNQGLWRAYLVLSEGIAITPEHVRGHTGHHENELCDLACNVVIRDGEDFRQTTQVGPIDIDGGEEVHWLFFDMENYLAALRQAAADVSSVSHGVESIIEAKGFNDFKGKGGANIKPVLARLKDAKRLADQLKGELPEAKELAAELQTLLKRFE